MLKLKVNKQTSQHVAIDEIMKPDVKVRLTFYLNYAEAERLRQLCASEDISVSHKVRQHVRQLFQHHQ